jgi:F1F0 ATPase subunit 2
MAETLMLLVSLSGGALLGLAFFGGLHWTVRRGLMARAPAVWFLGSLLLRTGLVLGGFYLLARDDWRRLLLCLVGFLVARTVLLRRPPIIGDAL